MPDPPDQRSPPPDDSTWTAPGATGPPPPPGWGPTAPPQGWAPGPPGWDATQPQPQPQWGGGPPPGWGQPPGWPARPPLPKAGSERTGPLPLHPMTVGDIVDGAFKLLKANARTMVAIAAVFVVPVQLVAAYAQRNTLGGAGLIEVFDDPSALEAAEQSGQSAGDLMLQLLALVGQQATLPLIGGAVAAVVAASYLGEDLGPGAALRRTGRKSWALLASWFLHLLAYIPATIACVLPVVFLMPMFMVVAPAVVAEDLGPLAGIGRSWRLVARRYWPVLGIGLLSGVIAYMVTTALTFVPGGVAVLVGLDWGWIIVAASGIVAAVITTPIVTIIAVLVYFDLRIRTEGFDLQMIADELGRGGGVGGR